MTQEKIKPYEGIDVWHMICCIAKKWWKILIAMIVCAVLLGAFSYYKNAKGLAEAENKDAAESGQENAGAQTLASSEEEILEQSGLSRKAAEEVLYYANKYYYNKMQYEHQNAYVQDSVLMQLDPNRVWTVTLYYDISVSGNEGVDESAEHMLAGAYLARISDEEVYKEITGELGDGVSSSYLSEIIAGSSLDAFSEDGDVTVLFGKGDFQIVIRYTDREGCEIIARIVKETVESSLSEVSGELGTHDIRLVGESIEQKADAELLNEQKNVIAALANLSDNVINARNNIETSEESVFYELLEYYEARDAGKAAFVQDSALEADEKEGSLTEENQEKVEKKKPGVSKKYVALGLLLGLFLGAAYEACKYFFSHTLKQKKELEEGYGLTVYDSRDKAVIKLAVEKKLEKNGWKTVYHASSSDSPAQDEKALGELMEADAVMLEEKLNVSSHGEIADLLELCRKLDKPVIGVIVES